MESLVLFVKQPLAGRTKTRLAKGRGQAIALRLYCAFLRDLARTCKQWRQQTVAVDPNRRLSIYAAPDVEDPILADIAQRAGARTAAQVEGDLGTRMRACFEQEFDRGARSVCIIGSDSPSLPRHYIDQAFRALRWEKVVFGPSFDGGYWLIGGQRPMPDVFSGIPWSSDGVLPRSLSQLRDLKTPGYLLPFWYDVDDDADLQRLIWHLRAQRDVDPSVGQETWEALVEMGVASSGTPST